MTEIENSRSISKDVGMVDSPKTNSRMAILELTEHLYISETRSPVRFSLTLDHTVNLRSEFLAKEFGMSKQELINKIYSAALHDLEASRGSRNSDGSLSEEYLLELKNFNESRANDKI